MTLKERDKIAWLLRDLLDIGLQLQEVYDKLKSLISEVDHAKTKEVGSEERV